MDDKVLEPLKYYDRQGNLKELRLQPLSLETANSQSLTNQKQASTFGALTVLSRHLETLKANINVDLSLFRIKNAF